MEDVGNMFIKTYKRAWSHNLQDHSISLWFGEGEILSPHASVHGEQPVHNDVLILRHVRMTNISYM